MECRLCGATTVSAVYVSGSTKICLCKMCKALSLFSDKKGEFDEKYFNENYSHISKKRGTQYKQILKRILHNKKEGSILDIGCGNGEFLAQAIDMGFTRNVGIDPSDQAILLAKKIIHSPNTLINGSILDIPNRKFEVITFINSITYIDQLKAVINNIRRMNLHDGGILCIQAQAIQSMYYRFVLIFRHFLPNTLLEKMLYLPQRKIIFLPGGLELFCRTLGFKILETHSSKDPKRKISLRSPKKFFMSIFFLFRSFFLFSETVIVSEP